jgi:RNA polymerase sigma-70 factor (ECF subfamily)
MASNDTKTDTGLHTRARAFIASVFGQFQHHLHRYLLRRLRSNQDARDLAQEVYLRLLRVENPSHITEPLAYVYRTAANVVTEYQMRRQRERVHFDSEVLEQRGEHPPELWPDELADQLNTQRAFQRALKTLPPVYRAVFLLRLRDDLPYADIATSLDLSVHTVRKYFLRAVGLVRAANWD